MIKIKSGWNKSSIPQFPRLFSELIAPTVLRKVKSLIAEYNGKETELYDKIKEGMMKTFTVFQKLSFYLAFYWTAMLLICL